jgi:hypothetical protein
VVLGGGGPKSPGVTSVPPIPLISDPPPPPLVKARKARGGGGGGVRYDYWTLIYFWGCVNVKLREGK